MKYNIECCLCEDTMCICLECLLRVLYCKYYSYYAKFNKDRIKPSGLCVFFFSTSVNIHFLWNYRLWVYFTNNIFIFCSFLSNFFFSYRNSFSIRVFSLSFILFFYSVSFAPFSFQSQSCDLLENHISSLWPFWWKNVRIWAFHKGRREKKNVNCAFVQLNLKWSASLRLLHHIKSTILICTNAIEVILLPPPHPNTKDEKKMWKMQWTKLCTRIDNRKLYVSPMLCGRKNIRILFLVHIKYIGRRKSCC